MDDLVTHTHTHTHTHTCAHDNTHNNTTHTHKSCFNHKHILLGTPLALRPTVIYSTVSYKPFIFVFIYVCNFPCFFFFFSYCLRPFYIEGCIYLWLKNRLIDLLIFRKLFIFISNTLMSITYTRCSSHHLH